MAQAQISNSAARFRFLSTMVFPTFAAYAATFGKVYNGDEAATRETIYNQAVVEMTAHNADESQTYTQGVNQFTDLTLEEFQALPIRGLATGKYSDLPKVGVHEIPAGEVAADVNWVTKGAVTPVSVAVEADQSSFQRYSSGVLSSGCGTSLDHGVLAAG